MTYVSLVDQAQEFLRGEIHPGDKVIDATVGNGYDTVFLASAVGDTGEVLGFDVQEQALENTRHVLQQKNLQHRVRLLLQSHADMAEHISENMQGRIKAVMFNLGYLPGSDKSVTTRSPATVIALKNALSQLVPGGAITVIAYRGHRGGAEETQEVLDWSSRLDPTFYTVQVITPPASSELSPLLIVIKKYS